MKIPVFILFGPTASGKTAILERLFAPEGGAAFRRPPGGTPAEIISADSMQVYRGMDIGTAKPSPEERAKIPYHLIDIRNPDEQFNAGEFVRLAGEACLAAAERGALPVVSGGTGFYLKNLVMGLGEAPPSDKTIRLELKAKLERAGAASLMEELLRADPVSAARIHINDEYRLLRALEVYHLTGRPLSSFASPWTSSGRNSPGAPERLCNDETHGGGERSSEGESPDGGEQASGPFRFLLAGLRRKREELYARINERAAAMMSAGLYDEVRRLYDAGYTPSDPGLKAIGYREFFVENLEEAVVPPESGGARAESPLPAAACLPQRGASWRLSKDLAGVEALIAQNSRRYAKRQITFFASIPGVKWIDCGENDIEERILDIRRVLNDFLSGE